MAIEAGICGDALWSGGTVGGNEEKIAIGADGFHRIGDGDETKFAAIRREYDVLEIAALNGRHIVIRAGSEIARRGTIQRRR